MDALEKEYFDEMKEDIQRQEDKIDLILEKLGIEYQDYDLFDALEKEEEEKEETLKTPVKKDELISL